MGKSGIYFSAKATGQNPDGTTKAFTITGTGTLTLNRDRYFSNKEEMIRWIDQPCIVPFLKCVPDIVKDIFRDEIITEMLKGTQQPNGTYFETFRRLKICAKK